MATNYRKAVNELAESLISTAIPASNKLFVDTYEKWVLKRRTDLPAGTPWSALFITYIMRMVGVPASVVPNFVTVQDLKDWADARKRFHPRESDYVPEAGDLILFEDSMADHVGIFQEMMGVKVVYIEGACPLTDSIVGRRSRVASSGMILGYVQPDYELKTTKGLVNSTQLAALIKPLRIQEFREWLIATYGIDFIERFVHGTPDGAFTPGWKHAVTAALQQELHLGDMDPDYVNGHFDEPLYDAINEKPVKVNSRGNRVTLLLGMLNTKGYDTKGLGTRFGANGKAALLAFQKARALPLTGEACARDWESLLTR